MKVMKKIITAAILTAATVFSAWAFDKDYTNVDYIGNFSTEEYSEAEKDFNVDFVNEYFTSEYDFYLDEDDCEVLTENNFDMYAREAADWIDAYIFELYDIEPCDCFYGLMLDIFDEDSGCLTMFLVQYGTENSHKLIRFNISPSLFE